MKKKNNINPLIISLMIIAGLLVMYNQVAIFGVTNKLMNSGNQFSISSKSFSNNGGNLDNVDLSSITSTAQSLLAVFPLDEIQNSQDAMDMIFPTGTPEYGKAMGVSFDDPIGSLGFLAKSFKSYKSEVEVNNPEAFQRYLNLATKPIGISCEYCCGLGPIGADNRGNSKCGCQHNPALLYVTLWLADNSDYSDAEILREALKWKTLFFPKDMIGLATNIATGEVDVDNLPGMVGGC